MEIFGYLVILLFAFALIDLIVGVSNDAVNFLNSAIGSKVASFRTILIIASLGILVGSVFSEGMMQIARSGIFQPSFFSFSQIMVILIAVMITDVLLLDLYNSMGLPTSTTVSIIFELLGASFAVGLIILWIGESDMLTQSDFINYRSALTIIGGIFISVFISFIFGSLIQYIARIVFTFRIEKQLNRFGAPFAGVAITTLIYFLLIKGAKGSAIITKEQANWINTHTIQILIVCFVIFTLLVGLLMRWINLHPLRLVVLMGTFSLAMAFAGNDLVNFIGVSVAGLNAFQAWAASGVSADAFNMGILNQQMQTPFWILLASGAVMTLTLWFNSKSRKVTETEVSLASQDESDERFRSGIVSRVLVGGALAVGNTLGRLVPKAFSKQVSRRFHRKKERKSSPDKPSFDLVRASINLVVASALIAFGTSQKLPLSTTFVTFMVAMGSSFADQAWGRESAVYRVAGVIRVISGWLLTALFAFTGSALVASILYFSGVTGIIVLSAIALFILLRSQVIFKRREAKEKQSSKSWYHTLLNYDDLVNESKKEIIANFKNVDDILRLSFLSLQDSKISQLKKSKKELDDLIGENNKLSNKMIKYIGRLEKAPASTGRHYLMVFNSMQNIHQSCLLISEVCLSHVINHHPPPDRDYMSALKKISTDFRNVLRHVNRSIQLLDFGEKKSIQLEKVSLQHYIDLQLEGLVIQLQQGKLGTRMGLLQTRILLEMGDILRDVVEIYSLYEKFSEDRLPQFR